MTLKATALALTLAAFGTGAALAQTPGPVTGQTNSQTRQDARDTPTIKPSDPQVQNPLVNPGAAGTQSGFKGYGATSPATGAHRVGSDNSASHEGLDDSGSVTPGAGVPRYDPSASPNAGRAATEGEARERLKQLGYTNIDRLQKVGGSQWQATAQKNNREVRVTINAQGNIVGER
jgi:hypothetical protein